MKADGDNLLAYLAARQRGTKNDKISFKIFKKVFLGRQFKQVCTYGLVNQTKTIYQHLKCFRIQSHLSRPVGNQSRQLAGFSLSTRKGLKHKHQGLDYLLTIKWWWMAITIMTMVMILMMTWVNSTKKPSNSSAHNFHSLEGFGYLAPVERYSTAIFWGQTRRKYKRLSTFFIYGKVCMNNMKAHICSVAERTKK